jgi:predicted PurR-regulated permease PerM
MPSSYPTPFQKRTLWNAVTGLAIVTLGALLVGLVWLGSQIFGYLQPVLVPLAFAGIVAYLLDPVVTRLMRRGLSRTRAVIVVFCGFTIAICLAALLVVPPISRQTAQLITDRDTIGNDLIVDLKKMGHKPLFQPVAEWASGLVDEDGNSIKKPTPYFQEEKKPATAPDASVVPDGSNEPATGEPANALYDKKGQLVENPDEAELTAAQEYRDRLSEATFSDRKLGYLLSENTGTLTATGVNWLKGGTSRILGLFGYGIGFAMVPIYLFFFLLESASIKANWQNYVPLKASRFKTEVVDTLAEINGYLISFFRGQVLVALIDGILVGIALTIFRLPYGLVIGLFLGILGIIPFIGNILCMIPARIIAYIHFSGADPNHQWLGSNPWAYVGAVIAIFLVVQQINSLVTAPKIVGDSVGLHPMTVIFSMLFWSLILGGFLGALLAVPLTAAVKVLVRRFIWERQIMDGPAVDGGPSVP